MHCARKKAVTTYYNGVYSGYNIRPYAPQINNKKVEEVPKEPEKPKHSAETDPDEQNSSSGHEYKSTIDYKGNRVNVSQILVDFKNTLTAIGVSEDIDVEVKSYLSLVDIQSQKPNPSQEIIKSNLKNAALILDDYITKALNKPSKVVTNWIDALLLQQIDYKTASKTTSNSKKLTAQQVSSTQPELAAIEPEIQTEERVKSQAINPETIKLNNIYKKSESLLEAGNYEKALVGLEKTLELAQKLDDKDTQIKAYMDVAFIHDSNLDLKEALDNYNNALTLAKETEDKFTTAKAHYNMATIYDDVGKVDTALDHYYSALALDGDTENIDGQSMTLNSIGNMHTVKGEYKDGLKYYKIAFGLAKDQDNKTAMASITSNVAGVFRDLGYDQKALGYYRDAIIYDMDASNISGYAKSYDLAGDILSRNGQTEKAKNLYKKSFSAAQKIGDRTWTAMMKDKIDNAV